MRVGLNEITQIRFGRDSGHFGREDTREDRVDPYFETTKRISMVASKAGKGRKDTYGVNLEASRLAQ